MTESDQPRPAPELTADLGAGLTLWALYQWDGKRAGRRLLDRHR